MVKVNIKIELSDYINNVFKNSSIDGENDYLKSIFDDRNFNINAFYVLNFEVYKGLLLDKKYNDKDFLKIKKNLFYCSNAKLIIEEVDFSLSKHYNTEDFIKKELNKSGTKFDKFCNLISKEDSTGVIKYLKKLDGIKEILKYKILNDNKFDRSLILKDFINKNDLFNFVKDIFTEDEIKNYINKNIGFNSFLRCFSSNKGLNYIKKLSIKDEILSLILNNDIFKKDLLESFFSSNLLKEFLLYLDIDEFLIEAFENENSYMGILKKIIQYKVGIEYLEGLGLKESICKKDNRNFDWLIEKISNTDYGKEYLKSFKNSNVNKALESEKNKIDIKKINNPDITKKELKEINDGKIKLDDKLHKILKSEVGINFLEENCDKEKISKELVNNPTLFTIICNSDYGVKYLRSLNLDNEVINQIKKESEKSQVYALLAHLLMTDEGIGYLEDLNKNNLLKENLLKEVLIFSKTQFNNLDKYKGLYVKKNIISALKGKHPIAEGVDSLLHSLSDTQEGIKIIIDADIKDKVRKNILETKDYHYMYTLRFFNDTPEGKQYLKDILNLETDNIKNQVYNFIKTSDSGSCLLSGYRGTGKTSLLNGVIKKLQDYSEEEIVKVVVNIPEKEKDKNGKNNFFNKNELITKVIRQIFLSLLDKGYSKKEIEKFEDQYIRTFKNIEEIEGNLKVTRKFSYKIVIQIISFSFSFIFGLFLTYLLPYLVVLSGLNIPEIILKVDNIKLYLAVILIALSYFVFISVFNIKFKGRLERTLYNDDIAEYKLNENILKFSKTENIFRKIFIILTKKYYLKKMLFKVIIFLRNIGKTKKRKLVIIIDELDKLLDLDKGIGNGNIDMKDIFDLLGKLKTLFFDNTGAIFFVVTNKDAYNYYLENKHSEDDLISNIFNKVLYLPMIKKENFNINRTFEIDGIDEKYKDKSDKRINDYFNDWIYYKSHGNWRKANFILNQKLYDKVITLDKENMEYDMKFYDFMNILYDLFIEDDNEKSEEKFNNNFVFGKFFYEFINKFILNGTYVEMREYKDDYQGIIKKIRDGLIFIKVDNHKVEINKKLNELTRKYINSEAFDTFAYIHSSVDKISSQPAYKDYVINSILNIIEILKHDRTLRIEDMLLKLKFSEIDVRYPAFEDLVLVYIPFMIYYFSNISEND